MRAMLVARFMDDAGLVGASDVADWFGMSKGQLAETVGVRPETLQRVQPRSARRRRKAGSKR